MWISKRKRVPMAVRGPDGREIPGHRAFVRAYACAVPGCGREPVEAHHVRKGIPTEEAGGTGIKSHDKWCVPLCGGADGGHHREAHDLGADMFDSKHGICLRDVAEWLWRRSPHRPRGPK